MSTFSTFKTDAELESKGFWYIAEDGSKWLLRSGNARRVRDAWDVARSPFAGMMQQLQRTGKQLPPEIDIKMSVNVLMSGIIADCEYTDKDENVCKFDRVKTREFLTDLPYLCNDLIRASQDFHNYLAANRADDAKNSDAPSSTNSNGGAVSINSPNESTTESQPHT